MATYTRVQKIQQTDYFKSGEWFTVSQLAQSVSMPVDDLRTILANNREIFEVRRVDTKHAFYRKRKPREVLPMRTKRFEFEGADTPRYF